MEEQEHQNLGQRTKTNNTNRLPRENADNNQNQKEEENNALLSTSSFLNKTNEVSAASELLHNFPIFNSRRGFGKPHSSLLRGGGKKHRVNTQTRQKVEFSLCFDLNISRQDLMSGLEEDANEGTVLKRILCRGISKVCNLFKRSQGIRHLISRVILVTSCSIFPLQPIQYDRLYGQKKWDTL